MKIESITIKHIIEEQPDLTYLGEYSNDPADVCIDRKERGDWRPGQYRYFNAGCSDPDYIEQDYKRMKAYLNQQWYSMGILAEAVVSYLPESSSPAGHRRSETFTSGGLWGIESDSGAALIEEVENEELCDLRQHLEQFSIKLADADWQRLCREAKGRIRVC